MEKIVPKPELGEKDKAAISEVFYNKIMSKLQNLSARTGTLNCTFADKKYETWNILFRSTAFGFEIVDFEYDENSVGIDLDL